MKGKHWTDEEVEVLKIHGSTLTAKQIHELYLPDRTVNSINWKRNKLEIEPEKSWYPGRRTLEGRVRLIRGERSE